MKFAVVFQRSTLGNKKFIKIFAFSTIFVIASSDIRTGDIKGILMVFRKLLKMVQ